MSVTCDTMIPVNERANVSQGFSNSISEYRPSGESTSLAASPFVNCPGGGSIMEVLST